MEAIQTYYNGYHFRSRLEARWAVFLDALGVKYEYEPEGFDLGDGQYYLPDFRVSCWGCRGAIEAKPFDLYIEVKGVMSEHDAKRIKKFLNYDEYGMPENSMLIVNGIPPKDAYSYGIESTIGYGLDAFSYSTVDGDNWGAYPTATRDGKFHLLDSESGYIEDQMRAELAYDCARQARFEHGETPTPESLRLTVINELNHLKKPCVFSRDVPLIDDKPF